MVSISIPHYTHYTQYTHSNMHKCTATNTAQMSEIDIYIIIVNTFLFFLIIHKHSHVLFNFEIRLIV